MRLAVAACAAASMLFTGCGYVGPVVPPSPEIPERITDLSAVERGDQIAIAFSTPLRTVDSIGIEEFSQIDLRIGAVAGTFDETQWEAAARPVEVSETYAGGDRDEPKSIAISKNIPAAEWQGKRVLIQVRTAVKKRGHFSAWSNPVTLDVIDPPQPPQVEAEATAAGYKLTWREQRPGMHFRVLRQGPNDKAPVVTGIAEKPEYVDGTAQWDTSYRYSVVAQLGGAESLPSTSIAVQHPDTFPPAIPTNLVALAGPDSVELTWSRNTEPDLKGYLIFRSTNGGPFERLGDVVTLPSFSDRKVEHGKHYRYAISSVDLKGNTSDNSAPAEVEF